MNALDLLIVVACVVAAFGGYRLGFLTRASAWLGLVLGFLAASRLAPLLSGRLDASSPTRALLIIAVTLLAGAFLGQLAGQSLGHRLRVRAARGRAASVDRVAGAFSGVLVVGAAVWLLTPTLVTVTTWPSRLVEGSLLAHQIDRLTPDPPDPLDAASHLIGRQRWVELQNELAGGVPTGPVPDLAPPDAGLDRRIRAATVLVEHQVCGRGTQDGTGFVAAPNLVVTNAHVVAGVPDRGASVLVVDDGGRPHRARVVRFDARVDLAVLRVESLDAAPLPLAERAERDTVGWVYGHPGGQALRVRPFLAGNETDARMPDLYDRGDVTRRIVPIRAELDHGDSGSALVAADGTVVGVAFAIAPDDESLAVAVAMSSVRAAVDAAVDAGPDAPEVGTGPCTADR